MATTFQVDIVSPAGIGYTAEATFVLARTTGGDIGIMAGHTPMIGALRIHPVTIRTENGEETFAVSGGFLEVSRGKVTILATAVERPADIDSARAEASRQRAEERLAKKEEGTDIARAEASLARARMRLMVKEKYTK